MWLFRRLRTQPSTKHQAQSTRRAAAPPHLPKKHPFSPFSAHFWPFSALFGLFCPVLAHFRRESGVPNVRLSRPARAGRDVRPPVPSRTRGTGCKSVWLFSPPIAPVPPDPTHGASAPKVGARPPQAERSAEASAPWPRHGVEKNAFERVRGRRNASPPQKHPFSPFSAHFRCESGVPNVRVRPCGSV